MSSDKKQNQIKEILKRLKKAYQGAPKTALHFSTPFELLVATILSAQTTDAQVNKVTEVLFKKFKSIQDFANTTPEQLATQMQSINFYHTKAKNIHATANMILHSFHGTVPASMKELVLLHGVARKTANIVLSTVYGIQEGIAVDTHVMRLAQRLGLTHYHEPIKIERELMLSTPQTEWGNLSHLLIFHGRSVCKARNPKHDRCVLFDICPSRSL